MKTYTIHRGTVRSSFALYHHVMPIYARHGRAEKALTEATDLVAAENGAKKMGARVAMARGHKPCSAILRAAQTELKNATARATEASKMHLVPFVAPYVPAKASRVYPALKTCTSPRRAAIACQRARAMAGAKASQASFTDKALFGTITGVNVKNVRITVAGREVKGFATGDEIRVETSLGYTAR